MIDGGEEVEVEYNRISDSGEGYHAIEGQESGDKGESDGAVYGEEG